MKRMVLVLLVAVFTACAGTCEEKVVQLVEDGQFTVAQNESKTCGAKGDELVRIAAFLYHGAGIADSSLAYLQKASAKTPKDPRIQLRIAEVMVWKKSFAAARDIVATVDAKRIRKEQRPWESMTRMANIHVYLQDFGKAEAEFLAVANDPDTPSSWATSARLYIAQIAAWKKDFARCIAVTDSVLRSIPGNVQASLLKGQVLEWQGKYDTARAVYTQAIQKHPDDWRLRDRLEKLSWVK